MAMWLCGYVAMFQISWPTRGVPWFGRKNKNSLRFLPDGGRQSTKSHENWRKGIHFLRRFQRIPLRLKVKGWIKRSLEFVRVLGSPRNKNKYLLASRPDLGFCTSTLKSFRFLDPFPHLNLKNHNLGSKKYCSWANVEIRARFKEWG